MPALNQSGECREDFQNGHVLSPVEVNAAQKATIEFDLVISGGMIVFKMGGPPEIVKRDDDHGSAIWVPRNNNLILTVNLSGWNWEFDQVSPLVPKKAAHDRYFHVDTVGSNRKQLILHLKASGLPHDHPDHDQQFNLKVLMMQPGARFPLPITIDPDVKNPPVGGDPPPPPPKVHTWLPILPYS
jgi:hypothetical protein